MVFGTQVGLRDLDVVDKLGRKGLGVTDELSVQERAKRVKQLLQDPTTTIVDVLLHRGKVVPEEGACCIGEKLAAVRMASIAAPSPPPCACLRWRVECIYRCRI
jgi:hypothetical protein